MGNFSKDPQSKLQESLARHYVGVRLQQGVPVLDADWNELEDLRRWELWSLLKWFIGDGVPENNSGFKIVPVAGGGVGTIILTSKKAHADWSSVTINRMLSTAADALGFGPQNYASGKIIGSAPARLTSDAAGTFPLNLAAGDKKLVIKTDDFVEEEIVFSSGNALITDIENVPVSEVVAIINAQAHDIAASAGEGKDYVITGGDGTSEGAGRCLVGGREALNEANLKYTSQVLYDNDALASKWGVAKIDPLKTPTVRRTDTVYLDIWEREVSSDEDREHLVDPRIGIETAVRIKREWAVRTLENKMMLPAAPAGHVFFRLATIVRDSAAITSLNIRDGRRRTRMLSTLDLDKIELNSRVKIIKNAIEHLSLRSRIDNMPSAAVRLPRVVVDTYSGPAGFQRLVDRFQTTARFNNDGRFYYAENDGNAPLVSQILADTNKPIIKILVTEKSRTLGPLPVATTVDVSLDGGNSFDLFNQSLDRDIDTQALPPNNERYQLVLRFNLPSASNTSDTWTARAALPAACSHLAAVAGADSRVYAIGGNSASSAIATVNTVLEYNDTDDTWRARTPMTQARYCACAAVRSFRLYAIGGSIDGTNPLDDVEEYDIKSNTWTTLAANMPTAREQLAIAAISDERIYAIGGLAAGGAVDLNSEFNPVRKTWTARHVFPGQRQGAVAAANSLDEIMVFGGITPGPTPFVDSLNKYDPFNDTWSSLAAMTAPRAGHSGAGTSNHYLYAFGGFAAAAQTPTNTNQEYNPFANVWTSRAIVPVQVKFAAAAAVHDTAIVVGGWGASGSNVLDSNLQYKPLLTTKMLQEGFGVEYTTSE